MKTHHNFNQYKQTKANTPDMQPLLGRRAEPMHAEQAVATNAGRARAEGTNAGRAGGTIDAADGGTSAGRRTEPVQAGGRNLCQQVGG